MHEPYEVTQAKSRALASAIRRASSREVVVFVAPIEGLIDNTLYRSVGGGRGLPRLANLDELRALMHETDDEWLDRVMEEFEPLPPWKWAKDADPTKGWITEVHLSWNIRDPKCADRIRALTMKIEPT